MKGDVAKGGGAGLVAHLQAFLIFWFVDFLQLKIYKMLQKTVGLTRNSNTDT